MAFEVAGLGGTFAAGMLGGMQSAQREREALANQREQEYLKTYQMLLKSGEWEPVGPKGALDGGVLKIGNVGMLKQRKQTELISPVKQAQIANYASLIESRKTKVGEVRSVPDVIRSEKGGEQVEVPAVRVEEWTGTEWRTQKVVPKLAPPSDKTVKTYIGKDGQPMYIRSDEIPPPGSIPYPTFVSSENLALRTAGVSAEGLETEAKTLLGEAAKLSQFGLIPYEEEGEGVVKTAQEKLVDYKAEAAGKIAEAQELKNRKSPVEAKKAGDVARAKAKEALMSEFKKATPKKGLVERGVETGKDVLGWAEEKRNAAQGAAAEMWDWVTKTLKEREASKSTEKTEQPHKFTGPANAPSYRARIKPRAKTKPKAQQPKKVMQPKFNKKLGTITY